MAWNRPSGKTVENGSGGGQRTARLKGIVAGAVVVIGAGIAAWLLMREEADTRPRQRERGLIREVTPAAAPKAKPASDPASAPALTNLVKNPPKQKFLGRVTTQSFSRVVTLADGTVTNLRSKATFKNPMEQMVSSALNPRGIVLPLRVALRRFSDEQIREMFHTDVKPAPGDSERVLERKLELQELKIRVRELEDEGYDYDQIFDEIDKIGRNTRAEIRAARSGLSQLIKAGESPELIQSWVNEKNAVLKEFGGPLLHVPKGFMPEPGQSN